MMLLVFCLSRFQELDLTAGALLLGDETRAAPWEQHIAKVLQTKGQFHLVKTKPWFIISVLFLCFIYLFIFYEKVGIEAAGWNVIVRVCEERVIAVNLQLTLGRRTGRHHGYYGEQGWRRCAIRATRHVDLHRQFASERSSCQR